MNLLPSPSDALPEPGGWLAVLLHWIGDNPSAWPLPFRAFLVWRQDQLMWALVQRLDALTDHRANFNFK